MNITFDGSNISHLISHIVDRASYDKDIENETFR